MCTTTCSNCTGGTGWCYYNCVLPYVKSGNSCQLPCSSGAPTFTSINPTSRTGFPGDTKSYSVTVKNNECSTSTLTISVNSCPSNFNCSLTGTCPSVAPGGTCTVTLNVTALSTAKTLVNTIQLKVSSTSGSNLGSATYYVQCDCSIVPGSVQASKTGLQKGEVFTISYSFFDSQNNPLSYNILGLYRGTTLDDSNCIATQNLLVSGSSCGNTRTGSFNVTAPTTDGSYTYQVSCVTTTNAMPPLPCSSGSGNPQQVTVYVDATPPTVNVYETEPPNHPLPAWSNNNPGVSLTCFDDSGSGCNTTGYLAQWNYPPGGPCGSCPVGPASYTTSITGYPTWGITFSGVKDICICAMAYDNAGNVGYSAGPSEYKIDTRPPDATLIGTPPGDWTTTTYTVGVSCYDNGLSGCDTSNMWIAKFTGDPGGYCVDLVHGAYSSHYPPDIQITSHVWVCGAAIDNAGNWGFTAGSPIEYKVDKQGPTVTVTGAPVVCGSFADASVTCLDEMPGLPSGVGCASSSYYGIMTFPTNPGSCPTNHNLYTNPSPYRIRSDSWVCGTAKDKLDNWGYSSPVHFDTFDTSPPSSIIGAVNTWQKSNFSFSVSDSDSGCGGVSTCYYRVDDAVAGNTVPSTPRSCNSSLTITVGLGNNCRTEGAGKCTVSVWSVDGVGETSPLSSKIFSIDYSSPQTTIMCGGNINCSSPPYYSGTPVTLICDDRPAGTNGVDNAGCASIYYCFSSTPGCTPSSSFSGQSGQFPLNNLGNNYIWYYSVDNLGNTEGPIKEMTVNINAGYILSVILAPASTGSGTVNFNPPDSSYYPLPHSFAYNGSTSVRITAVADPSSNFTGWSGAGCSGTSPCDLIMDSDKTVFATFEGNNPPVALMHAETQDIEPGHQDGPVGINWVNYNGQVFTIINDSSDSDGTIDSSNYSFTGPGSFHFCDNLPGNSSCTIQGMVPGDYTIRLTVTDDDNEPDVITNSITIKNDIEADFECSLDNATWGSCSGFKPLVGSTVYFIDRSSPSEGRIITSRIWQKDTDPPFSSANETNPSLIIKGTTIGLTVEDSLGRTDSQPYILSAVLPLPKWKEVSPF
jgi:hypothetical protein